MLFPPACLCLPTKNKMEDWTSWKYSTKRWRRSRWGSMYGRVSLQELVCGAASFKCGSGHIKAPKLRRGRFVASCFLQKSCCWVAVELASWICFLSLFLNTVCDLCVWPFFAAAPARGQICRTILCLFLDFSMCFMWVRGAAKILADVFWLTNNSFYKK